MVLGVTTCACGKEIDAEAQLRGRRARRRGNGHELKAARHYGGEKVGPLGRAEDIRGAEWATQLKTKQGVAPSMWRDAFAKMDAYPVPGLTPRLLIRFLPGPGIPVDDYFIVRGRDWLDRFGKDE